VLLKGVHREEATEEEGIRSNRAHGKMNIKGRNMNTNPESGERATQKVVKQRVRVIQKNVCWEREGGRGQSIPHLFRRYKEG